MVNVLAVPVQPALTGVTVIVAVTADVPLLVAVNEEISPVPLAARPMEVVLFVQLKVVPLTAPLKATAVVAAPLQTDWLETVFTVGVGLTVIVKVVAVPGQPAFTGVTVIVAVTGDVVLLVAVKDAISPVPLAARPIDVVLFVQLKVVLLNEPLKATAVVAAPLHSVWLETVFTVGVGFTVMVNVLAVPVQPFFTGVTVIVAVTGAVVLLVPVKEDISPEPLAARPMDVVLFVQLNVVLLIEPEKATAATAAPLQTVWFDTVFTSGIGFTVTFIVVVAV
jgi:hypothetical protein